MSYGEVDAKPEEWFKADSAEPRAFDYPLHTVPYPRTLNVVAIGYRRDGRSDVIIEWFETESGATCRSCDPYGLPYCGQDPSLDRTDVHAIEQLVFEARARDREISRLIREAQDARRRGIA